MGYRLQQLIRKIPLYQRYLETRLSQQSKFYDQNRIRVLDTYRFFLKYIPKIYPRQLQQVQKINEVRWIYKNSKQLPNIIETKGRTEHALKLKELNNKNYQNLGQYYPDSRHTIVPIMNHLRLYSHDKKLWKGHIY